MQDSVARASSPHSGSSRRRHAGWRSRGYLPHFNSPETVQHVVFQLADALPKSTMVGLEQVGAAERLTLVKRILLKGGGTRLLADPRVAAIVGGALLHFDGERYRLLAWCVMPTHVHALIEQMEGHPLSDVVHSWKSFTSNMINRTLERRGTLWAREYYDRFMRDEAQLEATRAYIESNPVIAGLCGLSDEWRFSSASATLRSSGPA